mmetsp:Transcript_71777/g.232427  ORF Transcript_71777/g.232427 Transcript_71777/m.232427 type:complete len:413 (+) Transcript_71777:227-1465(+)
MSVSLLAASCGDSLHVYTINKARLMPSEQKQGWQGHDKAWLSNAGCRAQDPPGELQQERTASPSRAARQVVHRAHMSYPNRLSRGSRRPDFGKRFAGERLPVLQAVARIDLNRRYRGLAGPIAVHRVVSAEAQRDAAVVVTRGLHVAKRPVDDAGVEAEGVPGSNLVGQHLGAALPKHLIDIRQQGELLPALVGRAVHEVPGAEEAPKVGAPEVADAGAQWHIVQGDPHRADLVPIDLPVRQVLVPRDGLLGPAPLQDGVHVEERRRARAHEFRDEARRLRACRHRGPAREPVDRLLIKDLILEHVQRALFRAFGKHRVPCGSSSDELSILSRPLHAVAEAAAHVGDPLGRESPLQVHHAVASVGLDVLQGHRQGTRIHRHVGCPCRQRSPLESGAGRQQRRPGKAQHTSTN